MVRPPSSNRHNCPKKGGNEGRCKQNQHKDGQYYCQNHQVICTKDNHNEKHLKREPCVKCEAKLAKKLAEEAAKKKAVQDEKDRKKAEMAKKQSEKDKGFNKKPKW